MSAGAHASDIETAVRAAWASIVVGSLDGHFDAHQAWEDTGADSLQAMQLLLALETALACKLSLDLIGPRTTATSLARSLDDSASESSPSALLPTVYLLPGLAGDEPRLAAFRRAFEGRIRFVLIDHPPLAGPAAVTSRLPATGAFAADKIEALAPEGDIRIAGYSFGGGVAFEATQQLVERGRNVAMLGILDVIVRDPSTAEVRLTWKQRLSARTAESDLLRPLALAIVALLWPSELARIRRSMIAQLRLGAMRCWRPRTCAAPTLCAMSVGTTAFQEARWLALCSNLSICVRLPAGHLEIFDARSMEVLVPAFASAFADSNDSYREPP